MNATGNQELDRLLAYLESKIVEDPKVREYCHRHAILAAYGDMPENRREPNFYLDQEEEVEPKRLQLYYATLSGMITGMLTQIATSQFTWFKVDK